MSHLSAETIARLVDDERSAAEAAHLESCTECRTQLAAMTEDVHALSMLPDMAAVPDQWDALERRLADEGLIRSRPHYAAGRGMRMMQIAAAAVLVLGGTIAGRLTAPANVRIVAAPPAPPAGDAEPVNRSSADATPPSTFAGEAPTAPSLIDMPVSRSPVTLAANSAYGRTAPASMDEAAQLLRETEARYLEALTAYAELALDAEAGDPVARLATLQSIILTTQAALNETPTDPVINGYHLTALAQRDATLRQVAAASSERWY
jgi:anti-sigma factor RsiW